MTKQFIEELYFKFYKTLNKEDLRVKFLENDRNRVYISEEVSYDYDSNGNSFTCKDVNYYWYEDILFLTKTENEKYYAKIWVTEYDRNQGKSDAYYKDFDNLKDAIKELREFFCDGNCVCVEIYNSNDKLCYNCDKSSEEFFINYSKIIKVDENVISKYFTCWSNSEKLPINAFLLYCKNEDETFTAIDNFDGECYIENFKNEKDVFDWLLGEYKIDEILKREKEDMEL